MIPRALVALIVDSEKINESPEGNEKRKAQKVLTSILVWHWTMKRCLSQQLLQQNNYLYNCNVSPVPLLQGGEGV